jgi:hypothetical protein
MRIERLAQDNPRTQGPQRRAEYRRQSHEHLRSVEALVETALATRGREAPGRAVVLGAGACTELPLERIARTNPEGVTLVDLDVPGMARARESLPASLRSRVELVKQDVTGGVSAFLAQELRAQPWADLVRLSPMAPVESAAACLERCAVPDPPLLPYLMPGGYGLVLSSFVLTQLYSLPLLDVVDTLSALAPQAVDLRESSPRYREAAQSFRRRVAQAHLALIDLLMAPDGVAMLASDRVGMLLPPTAGPHAREPRERLGVLPADVLAVPADLAARFTLASPVREWEWLATAPGPQTPGRLFEAFGVVLRHKVAGV